MFLGWFRLKRGFDNRLRGEFDQVRRELFEHGECVGSRCTFAFLGLGLRLRCRFRFRKKGEQRGSSRRVEEVRGYRTYKRQFPVGTGWPFPYRVGCETLPVTRRLACISRAEVHRVQVGIQLGGVRIIRFVTYRTKFFGRKGLARAVSSEIQDRPIG